MGRDRFGRQRSRPAHVVTAPGAAIAAACLVAAAYQLLALLATLRHLFSSDVPAPQRPPPVSILKPVRGAGDGFYEAIRSHARQDFPSGFELLFGVTGLDDPAVAEIDRLQREFPASAIRLIVATGTAPNAKVAVLISLAAEARYPFMVVNDGDILVPPGYLNRVAAPLSDPRVGLVTCLYRAESASFPGRFEALGIATDFAPSTLVAPLVGVSEFGLGSTLAFRRADLDSAGGFAAIAGYIADDYQLGARIHRLGRKNLVSKTVVVTNLQAPSWREIWNHQLRWARTIRVSRGAGYAGLPVTCASLWALLAALHGDFKIAAALLALRFMVAFVCGWFLLRSRDVLRYFWLIPLRDLFGLAVWAFGMFGRRVEWRGKTLELDAEGRIVIR